MKAHSEGMHMFEGPTLTLAQLGARWNLTPLQVLQHAQQPGVPLYFAFEGLAFDVADYWHRSDGDHDEIRKREHLIEMVERGEDLIRRAALGKLSRWEQLRDDQAVKLRATIENNKEEIRRLKDVLERREIERNDCHFRGYMRAAPSTLWDIECIGSTSFPHKAFHPLSPIRVVNIGNKPNGDPDLIWEGRLMSLEPLTGGSRYQKIRMTADDLFAITAEVKAIEAYMKAKSGPATSSTLEQSPIPITKLKKKALIEKYRKEWPSAESDINEAGRERNKSALKLARLDRGYYDEQKAVTWAVEQGKFKSASSGMPNSILNSPVSVFNRNNK